MKPAKCQPTASAMGFGTVQVRPPPRIIQAADDLVDQSRPSSRPPPMPVEPGAMARQQREDRPLPDVGRHRLPLGGVRSHMLLVPGELFWAGRKLDGQPSVRQPAIGIGKNLPGAPEHAIRLVHLLQGVTDDASGSGVGPHHVAVADPAVPNRVPVLDWAVTPRQPGHGHRNEILDLLAVHGVDTEPGRRIIEQLSIYLDEFVRYGIRCHPLDKRRLREDQLASECAGSTRAGDTNLRTRHTRPGVRGPCAWRRTNPGQGQPTKTPSCRRARAHGCEPVAAGVVGARRFGRCRPSCPPRRPRVSGTVARPRRRTAHDATRRDTTATRLGRGDDDRD
jgi:hypothetical protein